MMRLWAGLLCLILLSFEAQALMLESEYTDVEFFGVDANITEESLVDFGKGKAIVYTGHIPGLFNVSARVTMRGIAPSYLLTTNGMACGGCDVVSYNNTELVFDVDHFTSYRIRYPDQEDEDYVERIVDIGTYKPVEKKSVMVKSKSSVFKHIMLSFVFFVLLMISLGMLVRYYNKEDVQ